MRPGQKAVCGKCGRSDVVLVSRFIRGKRKTVFSDHYKPDNETWCKMSGKAVD